MCGLGILELGRNLPRSWRLPGEWEQATRWVGTGSKPQSGKRGCCFARKCCQTFPILRKSQKQRQTLSAHSTQRTFIYSVLGSKHDRACRLALHFVFSTAWLSKRTCFENNLLDSPRMRPFWSFITHTIASKSIGSAVKVFSDFYACAINIQPRTFIIAFPKLTHYLPLSLWWKGRNQRVCWVRSQWWQAGWISKYTLVVKTWMMAPQHLCFSCT